MGVLERAEGLLSSLTAFLFGSTLAVNHVGSRVCHVPGNPWVAAQLENVRPERLTMRRRGATDLRCLSGGLARVAFSLLCAGIFYSLWLGAFILFAESGRSFVKVIGWLSAPVATATGFTTGIVILEHLARKSRPNFFHIFIWPLIGCAIGAAAVYWFGPMLIVFGMFAAGTASVVLRELVLSIERDKN